MKKKLNYIAYIISILLLLIAIILVVEFNDSGRLHLIAGTLIALGVSTNFVAYLLRKN